MRKILFIILVFSLIGLYPKTVLAASLYLSPDKGNIGIGEVLSVKVRLDTTGESINAVSAFLSYPEDMLEVAWLKDSGSVFSINAESVTEGGLIKISRGNIDGVKGRVNISTIGFRGKSLGKARVSFVSGSAAPRASDSSDALNLGASRGGVYNVVAGGKLKATILGEAVDWAGGRLKNNREIQLLFIGVAGMTVFVIHKKRRGKSRS